MRNAVGFLAYAQLLDSALPIGGFSHSFGLETYIQHHRVATVQQLEQYMRDQLHHSIVRLDGLAIKGMYAAALEEDWEAFCAFDRILHVQRLARESREGSRKMGRRLLRLAERLYPEADAARLDAVLRERGAFGTMPAIHAWLCGKLGVTLEECVLGYLYMTVTMNVNSALRLMSIGQTEGQLLIRRMLADMDAQWAQVSDWPAWSLHSFAIAHDIRAMQHESLYSRLFMS